MNLAAAVIPFLGVLAGAVLLWRRFLGPRDLAIFTVMYLLTAIGVTVGFHRLLTHRAFETRRWLRYTLAILGSMSLQGPVIDWVADQPRHLGGVLDADAAQKAARFVRMCTRSGCPSSCSWTRLASCPDRARRNTV